MMKNTEKTIDEHKYLIGHWHVDKQLEVLKQLIVLLGESLVKMILTGDKKKPDAGLLDQEVNPEILSSAVKALVFRLDQTDVKAFFKNSVTDQVLCDGKRFDYNTHFSGRIGHLMKVSLAVLQHQYADFLDVLPGLSAQVREGMSTSQDS